MICLILIIGGVITFFCVAKEPVNKCKRYSRDIRKDESFFEKLRN